MRILLAAAVAILLVVMLAASLGLFPAPRHAPGQTFRDCADCPTMIAVPAGSFQMGSNDAQMNWAADLGEENEDIQDERPAHRVAVPQFAMSVAEVTRDQFDAFVRATGYRAGGPCRIYDEAGRAFVDAAGAGWRSPGFDQSGNHPVVCVGWDDAKAYTDWLARKTGRAYRLPSEAEWEYAARAGSTAGRHWGWKNEDACLYANVADAYAAEAFNWDPAELFACSDDYVFTAPVAQYEPNAFGLHDMMGNVWEWTADCYGASYTGAPTDGSPALGGDCSLRVDRGGSWSSIPRLVRAANRTGGAGRGSNLGFRLALSE